MLRKAKHDERAASERRRVGQRCGLLLWLLGHSLPGNVRESAPAGSYGADPAIGRLPGGAGTLLVLPGTRLDDGGGGGILAGTLLSRALVRRGASATVRREVRPGSCSCASRTWTRRKNCSISTAGKPS